MIDIKQEVPESGRIVICYRKWISSHPNSDGKFRTESILASRNTDNPYTFNEDISRNCWWKGYNEAKGRSWSDSTVEGWEEILP